MCAALRGVRWCAVLLVCGAPGGWGYGTGAPTSACATLTPSHRGNAAQASAAPYVIAYARLASGNGFKMNISAPQGSSYQGFMVQARSVLAPTEPLGSFSVVPEDAQAIDCGTGTANTVTHRSSSTKTSLIFEWQPPFDFTGTIIFQGTVLQNFSTFWTDVRSSVASVNSLEYAAVAASTVNDTPVSSDPMVAGCDSTKVCFGVPQGCVGSTTCQAIVTCHVTPDVAEFEMRANGSAYVAVGLSADNKMGGDSVVECVRSSPGGTPNIFTSWNAVQGNSNARIPGPPQDFGITLVSGSDVNGDISCKFQRNISTTVNGIEFHLTRDPQYILLASGSAADANGISYHDVMKAATRTAQLLTSGGTGVSSDPKVLQRLHGAVMLTAWVGTASIGILLARYFRQTWVGSQLCGKAQWFAWHQGLMVATWLLTIVGFIVIFSEVQGWSDLDLNPHAFLGVITTALAFVQPFMAFLRPAPDAPKRFIFNWAHLIVGTLAHSLAVVTIFFATKLDDADLPSWYIWLLVVFIVLYLLMHVLLTIAARSTANKISDRANNNIQMTDLRGPGAALAPPPPRDAPHSRCRKTILALYLSVTISLTVVLVVIAVMSPIG